MATITYDIALCDARQDTPEADIFLGPQNPWFAHIPRQRYDASRPSWFKAESDFATEAEARAFAAQFPKSAGLKVSRVSSDHGPYYYVGLSIKLSPDGVNAGINEAGIRRIRSLARTCSKLGIELVRESKWGNSSPRTIQEYGWA